MFGLSCCRTFQDFVLKSISVECNVRNLLVTCTSEFVYENKTDDDGEGVFSFPLEGSCVVYYLEAVINNKTIVGICKEVEEAKNMYKAAVEAGHKAAYIERNVSMTDVFKCHIGNFPKKSEAKIKLKFTKELKLSLVQSEDQLTDKFDLILPLILRPRYTPAGYTSDTSVFRVTNKYDYTFKASFVGTKVIKNVSCANYEINTKFLNDHNSYAEVTLVSKFDGEHDLDMVIDYVGAKVPSILYEYGTGSEKFIGKASDGAFYKPDVAMVNFLPKFEKDSVPSTKVEIVFIVDRSGSMSGSNIQKAKECLLLFLKSLPTDCKFQIYGFGSTFNKVFPHAQLYDDQSISTALEYQKNMEADLGGTELMQPLNDMYSSEVPSDYIRVAFILTDGDVGNQDEVTKLVRKHKLRTRVFTVGIGDGFSTSLIEKVAEAGNGKAAAARNTTELSGTVIELLDLGLNCSRFSDCKFECDCPEGVSVVMVPQQPPPVFSEYFVTVFCLISGLKSGESIRCKFAGKLNDKDVSYSIDINDKDAVVDEEFRVHRFLAKYKIDELTNSISDGQEDLKKSLIELSIEANMVTNYTTFVAIDPDAPEKALSGVDTSEEPVSRAMNFQSLRCLAAPGLMMKKTKCVPTKQCASTPLMKNVVVHSARLTGGGGGGGDGSGVLWRREYSPQFQSMKSDVSYSEKKRNVKKECYLKVSSEMTDETEETKPFDIVIYLAEKQNISGSWTFDEGLLQKLEINKQKLLDLKSDQTSDDMWITAVILQLLQNKFYSREKEWRLLAKKAKTLLQKVITDSVVFNGIMTKAECVTK